MECIHTHAQLVMDKVEGTLRSLMDTAMPRSEMVRISRLNISVFHHGGEQQQRMGDPTLAPAFRESMMEYERKISVCVDKVTDIVSSHPEEPTMNVKQVGLETTEIMSMAPRGMSLEQVRRGLIVTEFENMVGYVSDEDSRPVSCNAWDMDEIATEVYLYHEIHAAETLRDVLSKALSMQPEVMHACVFVRVGSLWRPCSLLCM
jgi:hypothetical protein